MSTSLMPTGKQQFFDNSGLPLSAGKVYTYAAGTVTPKATYTDAAGTTPQANPIVLNTRGEPANAIRWGGAYYVEVKDALGNLIYSVDDYVSVDAQVASATAAVNTLRTDLAAASGAGLVGFNQSGVGAILLTLQSVIRAISITPQQFGAVGDLSADDTNAIIKASDALQARGGGRLVIPKGRYQVFKSGVTYSRSDLISLNGLNGVVIDFSEAEIQVDPAKSWTGANGAFIKLTNCNDVTIIGGLFTSPAIALDGTFTGVEVVSMRGDCTNIQVPSLRATNVLAAVLMSTPTVTGASGIKIGNISAKGCIYGVNAANSGNDMVIDNLVTDGCGRSLFCYGVTNVKAKVRSKNPKFSADCSFSAVTAGRQLLHGFDVDYINIESGASSGPGAAVKISHAAGDVIGASALTDIKVRLNVKLAGTNMSSAFVYEKVKADGNPDTVARGHFLRNLTVSGFVDGAPASGVSVQLGNSGSVWDTNEYIYNVKLENLLLVNNTNSPSIDVKRIVLSLKGALTLSDIQCPKGIDVWGGSSAGAYTPPNPDARVEARNLICTNEGTPYEATEGLLGVNCIAVATGPFNVYSVHRGKTLTNSGSGGAIAFALPAAVPGANFNFSQTIANPMYLNPQAGEQFIGASAAGKYLMMNAVGTTVLLTCRSAGVWEQKKQGTTSFEP